MQVKLVSAWATITSLCFPVSCATVYLPLSCVDMLCYKNWKRYICRLTPLVSAVSIEMSKTLTEINSRTQLYSLKKKFNLDGAKCSWQDKNASIRHLWYIIMVALYCPYWRNIVCWKNAACDSGWKHERISLQSSFRKLYVSKRLITYRGFFYYSARNCGSAHRSRSYRLASNILINVSGLSWKIYRPFAVWKSLIYSIAERLP